jgi:hypothetical protein
MGTLQRGSNILGRVEEKIEELKVLQHNCNRNGDVFVSALESGLSLGVDLVLSQGQPTFGGYRYPGYEILRGGRVVIAIKKDTQFKVSPRIELGKEGEGDILVVDVQLQNLPKIRVVNIYDQKRFGSQERPAQKANWDTITTYRTILAGGFNAHSPRWNDTLSSTQDAGALRNLMDDNDLRYVGNKQPTRFSPTDRSSTTDSIIDLVLQRKI